MAGEMRMTYRDNGLGSGAFFYDGAEVISSVVLSDEKWAALGRPKKLIVIVESLDRDDRSSPTDEIPVITGESEVVEESFPGVRHLRPDEVDEMRAVLATGESEVIAVGDPVPGTKASFYGALDPAIGRRRDDVEGESFTVETEAGHFRSIYETTPRPVPYSRRVSRG